MAVFDFFIKVQIVLFVLSTCSCFKFSLYFNGQLDTDIGTVIFPSEKECSSLKEKKQFAKKDQITIFKKIACYFCVTTQYNYTIVTYGDCFEFCSKKQSHYCGYYYKDDSIITLLINTEYTISQCHIENDVMPHLKRVTPLNYERSPENYDKGSNFIFKQLYAHKLDTKSLRFKKSVKNSDEYEFFDKYFYYFGKDKYVDEFRTRTNQSISGFIYWDFYIDDHRYKDDKKNDCVTYSNQQDGQYMTVLSLIERELGVIKLGQESFEDLLRSARLVKEYRTRSAEQYGNGKNNFDINSLYVYRFSKHEHVRWLWNTIVSKLESILIY